MNTTPQSFVKAALSAEREQWTGVEVRELPANEADEALTTAFGELSLVPIEKDEWTKQLERAGFTAPKSTPRSIARADMRGELQTNQGATK